MSIDLGNIGLSAIRKITDLWSAGKSDSLIDYTQVARVEPIVLIDADCLYSDSIGQVQQSLLSIFAGYYLQALAISTTVGKIEVFRHLDRLNPKRSPMSSGADSAGWLLAQESLQHRLPMPGDDKRIAMEAVTDEQVRRWGNAARPDATLGRDAGTTMRELADLSVGKIFNVEITDGLHHATIPVSIRLMASSMPSASLVHILSLGSEDTSMKERYHAWRAGRLSFIKDLIFCQDLIDAHRKNLMADKDGVYTNLLKRSRTNTLSAVLSGNPSVATASNMAVISSETAQELERTTNGHLKDFKTREAIFKKTYLMIMAVLDKQWERVTFYHRGINGTTEVGVRDLKSANKGSGPDVADILRAYSLGNSPTL